MSSVNLWELYCTTESAYKTVWSIEQPTVCPTNSAHTISANPGPRIIQTITDNKVKIIEEDGVTQGIYKFHGYIKNIPSGPQGNVTTLTHTWHYPITLINGWFISGTDTTNDKIDLVVAENTVIGAITAPVYTGNTEISVTSTVLTNISKGYFVNITDGVHVDELGEVISIDQLNSKITVCDAATHTFSPLSPTYVRMSVKVIEDFYIPIEKQRYAFAEKKVGGKYIPTGIPLKIKYTNQNGNAKVFAYNMEYLY